MVEQSSASAIKIKKMIICLYAKFADVNRIIQFHVAKDMTIRFLTERK